MTLPLRHAIAPDFDWTSGGGSDLVIGFASGTTPVNVSVPSGTFRILLGTASTDFLRHVAAAVNAAMVTAMRSERVALGMSPSGLVRMVWTGPIDETAGSPLTELLGWTGDPATPSGTSFTADLPPRYFAAFVGRGRAGWQRKTVSASALTVDGRAMGTRLPSARWEDELAFEFIPSNPTARDLLGATQTPWDPDDAYLGALGDHAGLWSVSDVLEASRGRTVAFADGNYQDIAGGDSTARYQLCSIAPTDVDAPRVAFEDPSVESYRRWTVMMVRRGATPSEARG